MEPVLIYTDTAFAAFFCRSPSPMISPSSAAARSPPYTSQLSLRYIMR